MRDDDRADHILVPESHIHRDRTQGCWNCKHSQSGKELWSRERQKNLRTALKYAQESPMGENDQRVYNIRGMVNKLDHGIASREMLQCTGEGKNAHGDPVGDFVPHNYLCTKWSAAEGASLAREFGKTDKLPEELFEDVNSQPIPTLDALLAEKKS